MTLIFPGACPVCGWEPPPVPRCAWPGLLLAILACLAIVAAVWWSRNEAEQKNIHRNIKTWEELEKKVHPNA